MADDSLDILIRVHSDKSAATEAINDLAKVGQEGKGAHNVIAEAAESVNIKHREAHKLLGLLGEQFGAVGEIAHVGMFGPMGAGLGAVLIGVKLVTEAFQEFDKKATEASERAAQSMSDVKAALNGAADELYKVIAAHDQWVESMDHSTGEIVSQLDLVIQKIKQEGKILGVPESGQTVQERDATAQALKGVSEARMAASGEVATAQKRVEDSAAASARVKQLEEERDSAKETAKEEKKLEEEAVQRAEKIRAHNQELGYDDPIYKIGLESADSEAESHRAARVQALALASQADDEIARRKAAGEQAQHELDRSKKVMEELNGQFENLSNKLDSLNQKISLDQAGAVLAGSPIAATVQAGADAQAALAHGQKLSDSQKGAHDALFQLLTNLHLLNTAMMARVVAANGNAEKLASLVTDLARQQQSLEARLKGMHNL